MQITLLENDIRSLLAQERAAIINEIKLLLTSGGRSTKNLNAKQAADFLGISISTLYKSLHRIPHKRFGKKLLFSQAELEGIRH